MDPKGYEKKPWFPYVKNMYDEIEEDMMAVDAKGYEEKPWWPYVQDLQEKIDAGGGSSDFSTATVTITIDTTETTTLGLTLYNVVYIEDGIAIINTENIVNILNDRFDVILYQNKCPIEDPDGIILSAEGSIEQFEGGYFIKGDCHFTVKVKSSN